MVQKVEFDQWRAAESVDEQDRFAAPLGRKIDEDRVDHFLDDRVSGSKSDPSSTGLAVDADAHFDFLVAEFEVRLARGRNGAGRQRNAHGARAAVDALAERLQLRELHSRFGRSADDLFDDQRPRDAASAGRIGRSLNRHVIVGNDRDTAAVSHFRRHFEVHDVAFVVLDDQNDALSLIDGLDRGEASDRASAR